MKTENHNYGKEFEEEVKSFIENKFNFKDVKGGPDFHIAPPGKSNQTDVCGRWHDFYLFFNVKPQAEKLRKA